MLSAIEIIKFEITDGGGINFEINAWIGGAILIILLLFYVIRSYKNFTLYRKSFDIDGIELGIGGQSISLKPNYVDRQIAHKLWTELNTRKLGIEIDFENDVIYEVYNSWYAFFKTTRELIKDIPVEKIISNPDTKKFIQLSVDVLNIGLRPHLTLWQAKFRKWYEEQLKTGKPLAPQELQKQFPEYKELVSDMRLVNKRLILYKEKLQEIAWEV